MKLNDILRCTGRSYRVNAAATAVACIVPLLAVVTPASAETRGYVISWFATATNNPDFASNCPEAAKNPNRVLFVAAAGARGRNDAATVNGKPVAALDYPDAVQKDPNIETVVGKYA